MPLTRRWLLQALGLGGAAVATASVLPASADPRVEAFRESAAAPTTLAASDGPTRLNLFLLSRGIKPAHLARESGYTRQHLLRVRMGRIDPDARCMTAVVEAARILSREYVRASDLFGDAAIRAGIDRGRSW
jgi:hypothetical protein